MNRNIYLVTDSRAKLLNIIKQYAQLKIGFIQYRDKFAHDAAFIKMAQKIYKITQIYGIKLIINDRIHLLDKLQCDGFHVGQHDEHHATIRKKYPHLHMGVSVHNAKEAQQAIKIGANLVGVGAMFPTNTKAHARRTSITTLIKIKKITNEIAVIGGINAQNIASIPQNLYKYVALSAYLLDADQPQEALSKLQLGIKHARSF